MQEINDTQLYIHFSFTDENNQTCTVDKSINPCVLEHTDELDLLLDEFKCFLRAVGHSEDNINKIRYVED